MSDSRSSKNDGYKTGDSVLANNGITYRAVKDNLPCTRCALNGQEMSGLCRSTECFNVVWLTQLNYITHRLTK